MSYKNDSELVILNRYSKASSACKAELFETYDRLRDLIDSGPTLGGSGLGKFSSLIMNVARSFGSSQFVPTYGSEAINIPGTSYYNPISGGTGITPGGEAAFGVAPMSHSNGFPSGGAAPIGIGMLAGAAAPLGGGGIGAAGGLGVGAIAGAGFGRNWVMPLAGIASGIGGILTTLSPYFGPLGLAGGAAGSLLNGLSGAILSSFQHVSNRVLVNADTILTSKIKNLETTSKQLDAQQDIIRKLLKESIDGDKKALDNI